MKAPWIAAVAVFASFPLAELGAADEKPTSLVYDTPKEILEMAPRDGKVVKNAPCYVKLEAKDGTTFHIGSPAIGAEVGRFLDLLEYGKNYRFPDAFVAYRKTLPKPGNFGEARGGIQVGISVKGYRLGVAMKNVLKEPIDVMTHTAAPGKPHYDQLTLYVTDSEGVVTKTGFLDEASHPHPKFVSLKPGEVHIESIDLKKWSTVSDFRFKPKAGETYQLFVEYRVPNSQTIRREGRVLASGPAMSRSIPVRYDGEKGFAGLRRE